MHIPVLLNEVLALLAPAPGEVYADGTAGLGGHAAAVARAMGPGAVVLADLDPGNLAHAAAHVQQQAPAVRVVQAPGNFAAMPYALAQHGLRANMVLADLGFASPQVDDPARGLSFLREGPLDMRLDPRGPLTAAQIVASWPEADLERIIRDFGEDRLARLIARRINQARGRGPITTTTQLADICRAAYASAGNRERTIDPATRTFQALRIAVNDELGNLSALLDAVVDAAHGRATAPPWLAPGCRVAIISFHSLEDRLVKQAMGGLVAAGRADDLTPEIVRASEAEQSSNPRSRSAKLRAVRLR